jgi:hypothetical protein
MTVEEFSEKLKLMLDERQSYWERGGEELDGPAGMRCRARAEAYHEAIVLTGVLLSQSKQPVELTAAPLGDAERGGGQ